MAVTRQNYIMDTDTYTQEQVADLLGVSVRTLRQWRLSNPPSLRLWLPCVKARPTGRSHYTREALLDFCRRNPRYGNKVLALLAPDSAQYLIAA